MNNRKYNQYDVTIAGAGPSGSILAYELAKKGLKVLVLEKYKIPRNKVCAGGVTVRAASLLPFDFNDLILDTIYGVRLSYQMTPHRVRIYEKPLAYMVARDRFDALLASQAREAGATVEDGVEVKDLQLNSGYVLVKTDSDTFSTPLLVGADGANSRVVHALGIRAGFEYGLGVNGNIPVDTEVYALWDGLMGLDYGIPGGYAWVFPKGEYLSVGAGSSFRVSKKLRPYTLQLTQSYQLGTVNGDAIKGHLMPLKKASTRLVHDRVLLVGDAAGLIDPLSGEGMFYGIKSSYLAASSIVKFLEGKIPDLSEYDENINRELMPELKIARTIQKLNSATPRIFFYFLEHNDRLWRAFCRMLRGERTYQSLKNRLPLPIRPLFRVF